MRFFDVRNAPRRNQPPDKSETIGTDQLIELIDDAVVLRNTGVSRHERYAEADVTWSPPAGSLPEGLDKESPLTLNEVIESAGGDADQSEE